MKKQIFASVALTLLIAFSVVSTVAAQTSGSGNGFRISPVREELTIQPGKSQSVDVTVENITNEPIIAHPVINDFVASNEEDGQPRLLLDQTAPISGNSIKLLIKDLPDIPLKPKEKKIVKVAINVPTDAAAGGYYGALRFSPANLTDKKQVSLTASVGVLFLIKVPGNIVERLDLLTLAAGNGDRSGGLFFKSPEKTVTRLKNTGSIHVQPYGRVVVKDWRGKEISNQEFNNVDPRANVLPNSTRKFDTPLKAKANFGRYTIYANLGYGTSGNLITAKATFWVLPIWFLITLGVIILLIVGLVLVWRRKRKRRRHYR